jgi:hypothetical protein
MNFILAVQTAVLVAAAGVFVAAAPVGAQQAQGHAVKPGSASGHAQQR